MLLASDHSSFFFNFFSVDYEVVVEDEAAMIDLSAAVVSKMADSSAFTTALVATMKTNGVTSVKVDAIKADTTKEPRNAGVSGGEIPEIVSTDDDDESSGQKKSRPNLIVVILLAVTAAVI